MSSSPPVLASEIVLAWSAVQSRHPQLPDLAHPESLIDEASTACGTELDFDRILHEAAHALALARGIRDTSRAGRYHNSRFLAMAEEIGMEHTGTSATLGGFGKVSMRPETRTLYGPAIARLREALGILREQHRADVKTFGGPSSRLTPAGGGVRVKVMCACERSLYVVPSVLKEGPILCSRCGRAFAPPR